MFLQFCPDGEDVFRINAVNNDLQQRVFKLFEGLLRNPDILSKIRGRNIQTG